MVESSEGSVANGRFAAVTAKKECLGTGPDIVRTCRPYCAKTSVCLSHGSCELLRLDVSFERHMLRRGY